MNALSRQMIRLIHSNLQVGDEAPTYIIKLRRADEFHLPPKELTVPVGGVVNIETTGSDQFGCATATVTIENCYGLKSGEFLVAKHKDDSAIIADSQMNAKQQEYYQYLIPETWIQICLGYGWMHVPVLTGAIDTSDINSGASTISLNIRDNMRYMVDQHIDVMVHGKQLTYPRTDNLVIISDPDPDTSNKVELVKIVNVNTLLNVRIGPGTEYDSIGKAYNGQCFQYVDETINTSGNKWYKIKFNNLDRWIYHEYAQLTSTSSTIKYGSTVKVDKIKNTTGNHLHVRSGPGVANPEIGQLSYGEVESYIETQSVNGVPWFHIKFNSTDGWVCGNYASVDENDTPATSALEFHDHLHVKASADSNSADVGLVYDGNKYTFISTFKDNIGNYWHKIQFKDEDGNTIQGWLDDESSSYEQEANIISAHTIAEVVNVSTHLHIRSGPSTSFNILSQVHQGTKLPYIGSIVGKDSKSTWHHILYIGSDGKYHEGYIHGSYANIHAGYSPNYANNADKPAVDPTIMVDMTATTNPDNNKWTASGVVHDLAVQAMYIGGRGGPSKLDRKICDVWTSEYTIKDPTTNQPSRYVINEHTFPYTLSYFDSAMQIVNQMGDMSFRSNRYGDIMLFRNKICTQRDDPDWEVRDYVDLTEASLKYNVQDMRNTVLVISDNGSSLFEHKGIAFNQCKGVNRQFGLTVPFADTLEKRKEAARSAFQQIASNWRRMSIAIVGNPMIEIGDTVKVYDMVTTATSLFKVSEFKHNFSSEAFITQLELVWIASVPETDVSLLSEDIPNFSKRFRYNLKFTGNIKPMKFKMSSSIYRALIRLKDPITDEIFANIEVKGNIKTTTPTITAPQKYIKLVKDGVNVRTKADLAKTYIKKTRNSGFTMKYLAETDTFYKGIDPEDGNEAYIWKDYCTTYESNGNDSTNLSSDGAIGTFISTVISKVGCGYVWGSQGQMLTSSKLKELEGTFGYSHYHFTENGVQIDAGNWIGSQVFDCSGLVVWTLQQMGLISSSSDYSASGLFKDLCYEISRNDVQPGDLFFRQGKGGIYHVGVIVSDTDVVEARGTSYGVIQRAIPSAEKYGRIKKLAGATSYTTPQTTNSTPVEVNVTPLPTSYTIITTYKVADAPQVAKDKVKVLSGNLLFYKDDCVLYYVGVESDGGEKNELVLKWAPTVSTPKNLDLTYDVLMY